MKAAPLAVALRRALLLAFVLAAPVHADVAGDEAADADTASAADELATIEVTGDIVYRDRSDATAPVLSYELEYFQRFEPLTAGDMLKRVPSVAFVSDVLEYDGARLRGLDPGYTQILINGKKVPGAGTDRAFFVDRIPAEMVERIEIIRATSANRSGDAVAGAINIVLRNAYEFDGGYARAGALHFDDGTVKPTYASVVSTDAGAGRLLAGFNVQGRYNPKQKRSQRFEAPGGDFDNREDQSDVRDGTDYSAHASYALSGDAGDLSISGFYVRTERSETEQSFEYNDTSAVDSDHLLSINDQRENIDQHNAAIELDYAVAMAGGETRLDLGWADFSDGSVLTEEETAFDDDDAPPSFDGREGTRERLAADDTEYSLKLAHEHRLAVGALEFGVDYSRKDRDTRLAVSEVDVGEEGAPLPPYVEFDVFETRIAERRVDPYAMLDGETGAFEWEAGLRYESTDARVRGDGERFEQDYARLLPSAHLRWNLTDADRVSLSLGRSLRRPNFGHLVPTLLEGEFGDNDFVGNPLLRPELANGIDLGFERRLGSDGIVGVNVFYRDVTDLIEVVNTGEASATATEDYEDEVADFIDENPGANPGTPGYPEFDPDSFVYSVANVGDGFVYGVEFDLSTPLSAFGLDDTGVFVNYSWLDSEVEDALGERMFNDQAKYVANLGFIQDLPSWGVAFGVSYRRQGDAFARLLAEEVHTRYGADLEVFVEKRFGRQMSWRLTASNLLDAAKDETFNKFDTLGDQLDRDFDEYEIEREKAGPMVQLIARYAF